MSSNPAVLRKFGGNCAEGQRTSLQGDDHERFPTVGKRVCENSAGALTYSVSSLLLSGCASTAENAEGGPPPSPEAWAAAGMLSLPCTPRVSNEHRFPLKSHKKTSF